MLQSLFPTVWPPHREDQPHLDIETQGQPPRGPRHQQMQFNKTFKGSALALTPLFWGQPQAILFPSSVLGLTLLCYSANSYSSSKTHCRGHFLRTPFLTFPNRVALLSGPDACLHQGLSSWVMVSAHARLSF